MGNNEDKQISKSIMFYSNRAYDKFSEICKSQNTTASRELNALMNSIIVNPEKLLTGIVSPDGNCYTNEQFQAVVKKDKEKADKQYAEKMKREEEIK